MIILLGLTALASYAIGRQGAADGKGAAPPAPAAQVVALAKPVAPLAALPDATASPSLARPQTDRRAIQAPTSPAPPAKPESERVPASTQAKPTPPDKPAASDTKRKVETALTAAAIVAILIKASRDQYYATGHPCACPDDLMRNGRACGARSAHSRPGGASPLCYPADVTAEMIEAYRRQAARASR
ncbi:hypothetical protein [Bradyrhizobium sp. SZCCHNS30592]|uniref:hypothetical protein n=1 Tax=Bradyrhizobium sp. SZCCHNS30592 TaxID=3057329 RepID=UPI0029168256|nr:hypothetical protein [Bradyrhizobium sp. SZCCHNS30592]